MFQDLNSEAFCRDVFGKAAVFGQCTHHREAPEAVAADQADVAIVYYHLALRYKRIFPDQFDAIPLGGTRTDPEPPPENLIGKIHMGLIDFFSFADKKKTAVFVVSESVDNAL